MLHAPVRPRASFASLLLMDDGGELRSAPHAVRQGAPAREAMPQKTIPRQARGLKLALKISRIALKTRRKIFCAAIAKNRLPRPAVSLYSEILAKIRKE
jgi:hypothetical protein